MLFNSIEYLALLATAVAAYWSVSDQRFRQLILLLASVVFYMSWLPAYIVLLLAVISVNFALTTTPWARGNIRLATLIVVVFNLAVLGFFKYINFAQSVVIDFGGLFGVTIGASAVSIILPLGISFYIFQLISYVIDVQRGELQPESNPAVLILFVMFFPHLIAGPICRGSVLLPQLKETQKFTSDDFVHGLLILASGLFLKVAIADNISPFTNEVFGGPAKASSADAVLAVVGFGIVILCDFWGYSTMALGSALLFGINLPANFNLPYLATSLQDFWRRWHITLSSWLRDYLYIPLGGSRATPFRTGGNLVLVMVLGGLWHGAAYTFLIWGGIHGAWLVLERSVQRRWRHLAWSRAPGIEMASSIFGWATTMLIVFAAWVFFRADSVSSALELIVRATGGYGGSLSPSGLRAAPVILLFALIHIPVHFLQTERRRLMLPQHVQVVLICWLTTAAVFLGSGDVAEFIYFQF